MKKSQKELMLKIAHQAIEEELTGKRLIEKEALLQDNPWLGEKGAVFVTLNENNQLRGCIGSIIAHQPLIDDLIYNAKASAFNDPRFYPVSSREYEKLDIDISLLSTPKELHYIDIDDLRDKIRVGVDGVILRLGSYQATYLPSVWEQIPDFDLFFSTLCQKAGLEANCLRNHPSIYIYQAQKITEEK